MKRETLASLLVATVLLSVLATSFFCFRSVQLGRLQRRYQQEAGAINQNRVVLQRLVAECLEYSRKNPAILPVLESVGVRPRAAAPTLGTGTTP